jgi:hypothetical protein
MKCNECIKKQQIIDILHKTCAKYEARIKRFQTLSKKRRKNKTKNKAWEKWLNEVGISDIVAIYESRRRQGR